MHSAIHLYICYPFSSWEQKLQNLHPIQRLARLMRLAISFPSPTFWGYILPVRDCSPQMYLSIYGEPSCQLKRSGVKKKRCPKFKVIAPCDFCCTNTGIGFHFYLKKSFMSRLLLTVGHLLFKDTYLHLGYNCIYYDTMDLEEGERERKSDKIPVRTLYIPGSPLDMRGCYDRILGLTRILAPPN